MESSEPKKIFEDLGYFIFNINDPDLIDEVNRDVSELLSENSFKTNNGIYQYNSSPRVVESWKASQHCKRLAKHHSIFSILSELYESTPLPFSTINFLHSTEQPFHSDYVHFGTVPDLRLAGSWIALENIDPRSGPLSIIPRSHKIPFFQFKRDLGLEFPKSLSSMKANYSEYEKWVKQMIKTASLEVFTPELKKGDCIIWAANLLHGSPYCQDSSLSRKSQVTHWIFDDVKFSYNPNFSSPSQLFYTKREITTF
jgi:ectoine hydroxylase-related dioxygenase (phytanoyl-CoA dioxygenase family)